MSVTTKIRTLLRQRPGAMRFRAFIPFLLAAICFLSQPGLGAVLILDTDQSQFTAGVANQGWWSPTAANNDLNDILFVGGSSTPALHRGFITFDLDHPDLVGVAINSATVTLDQVGGGGGIHTLEFHDVAADAATVNFNSGTSSALYIDLGSASLYGTFQVDSGTLGQKQFSLNSSGLLSLDDALGGFFTIGLTLEDQQFSEFLNFGSTPAMLTLDYQFVSEPLAVWLILGFMPIVYSMRIATQPGSTY